MFILAIVLIIVLIASILSLASKYASKELTTQALVELSNTIIGFLYVGIILGVVEKIYFIKFMDSMGKAIKSYSDVDSALESVSTSYSSLLYTYPVNEVLMYPKRFMAYLIVQVIALFISIPLIVYGITLSITGYQLAGTLALIIVFIVTILMMVISYKFYNSIKEYFGVGNAGTLAVIIVIRLILSVIELIPGINAVIGLIDLILFIVFIIVFRNMLNEFMERTSDIEIRLSDRVALLRKQQSISNP